eukprot:TRINITY_DN2465_c0_g2_i3.p1 TRINITY_DN2465_c0_g2~~TRINITY_DN2465_c0_g2_i3.p1  ORF type:complete len:281 (-),score=14.90 TRINITY_DN2465_c0_g2_i3:131-895(-)
MYSFELNAPFVANSQLVFSSYPGFLESLDDFYIMSNQKVMLQTTNSIFNHSLYDQVIPQSLFAWQRVRLALMLAHDGEEWCDLITPYNSGTYNNQYMVIDYTKFQKDVALLPGALWVAEQIPGLVMKADLTEILQFGYWPSYNVPFFPEIYELSGYPAVVEQFGPSYSYQMAPRARIFRRDQDDVTDWDSFKAILRYNDYLNDPYSEKNPMWACSWQRLLTVRLLLTVFLRSPGPLNSILRRIMESLTSTTSIS